MSGSCQTLSKDAPPPILYAINKQKIFNYCVSNKKKQGATDLLKIMGRIKNWFNRFAQDARMGGSSLDQIWFALSNDY